MKYTEKELEQMTNEQLGKLYEQEIGYNPFDEEEITYERGGRKRDAEDIRESCIEVLSEEEE